MTRAPEWQKILMKRTPQLESLYQEIADLKKEIKRLRKIIKADQKELVTNRKIYEG